MTFSQIICNNTKRDQRASLGFGLFRYAGVMLLAGSLAACQSTNLQNAALSGQNSQAGSAANLDSLTAVVERTPNDPNAYNIRGAALGKAGRYDDAIADFNRALQINPRFAQAYANRGLVYRLKNDDANALADYNRALQVNPQYANAYVRRGNVYRRQNQLALALEDYNQAIKIDRTDPEAFHNRGLVYQAQKLHNFALEDFTTAIGLSPQAAPPYNARGESYLVTGDAQSALEDFNAAVSRDRGNAKAWYNQGVALQRLNRNKEAASAFQKALTLDPSLPNARDALNQARSTS